MRKKNKLNIFLESHSSLFENISKPIKDVEHSINTSHHSPISTAPYRLSLAMKSKLHVQLNEMINSGIIEEADSPWAFPVVLIPKRTTIFECALTTDV